MKRGSEVFAFVILVSLIFSSFLVSAQDLGNDMSQIIDDFTGFVKPLAEKVLGTTPSGQYLFAKVLFLFIIFAIVWTILNRVDFFSENSWVLWIITIAVAILSTRWLTTEGLIQTIILPYSALGIAISAGLPFVLWFLLVHVGLGKTSRTIRRTAWIFFIVIFIGLWITRRTDLMAGGSKAYYIYPITALISFFMLIMDGTIHRFFVQLDIEKSGKSNREELVAELKRKINQANQDSAEGIITEGERDRRVKDYRKRIAYVNK